jgi:hypothetical protein
MVLWWLFAIAFLLFALQFREHYTDPDRAIPRPVLTSAGTIPTIWQTKIDANASILSNDMDYFNALQAFYDRVYNPSPTRPTDTQVEAFLKNAPEANVQDMDKISLRKMIGSSFSIEATVSAAAREQREIATTGALAGFSGSNLQPGNARDQVYDRTEGSYTPADTRIGELPEGLYAPTEQTEPSRPGRFPAGTSWTSVRPYSVCPCAENVL